VDKRNKNSHRVARGSVDLRTIDLMLATNHPPFARDEGRRIECNQ
jgi:hypothetical protein